MRHLCLFSCRFYGSGVIEVHCVPVLSPRSIRTMVPPRHTDRLQLILLLVSPPPCTLTRPHHSTSPLAKRQDDYLYGRARVRGRVLYYERCARYSNIASIRGNMVTLAIPAFSFILCLHISSSIGGLDIPRVARVRMLICLSLFISTSLL